MARCESSGMRRDRIMMTERRKNRRTEEKKARLAAEAAAKAVADAKAMSAKTHASTVQQQLQQASPELSVPEAIIPKTEGPVSPDVQGTGSHGSNSTLSPHCQNIPTIPTCSMVNVKAEMNSSMDFKTELPGADSPPCSTIQTNSNLPQIKIEQQDSPPQQQQQLQQQQQQPRHEQFHPASSYRGDQTTTGSTIHNLRKTNPRDQSI